MPTPSNNTPIEAISTRTCPEPDRNAWRDTESSDLINVIASERSTEPSVRSRSDDGSMTTPTKAEKLAPIVDDEPEPIRATSPAESTCIRSQSPSLPQSSSSLLSWEFSNVRLLPNHTSSFLRSGSKFVGTQQSDRQVYNVDVEIKHVDMAESYLCGYLRIQGLTEDHPTLTTFFEGEIIGTKHTFQTRNEEWGASEKTDLHHWSRFPAWRPLAKQAKRADFTYRNFAQREHIFMRWKESFLVPDHRVRTISGASFEGFYYICFNQIEGTVSGVYFHAKSERFQQLELKHVEDRGCAPAVEFR
ncbi:unnamed protein product [Penicillium salamii]|uniref:Vacuolar import and degradation protein n=1 Tax=Penicillium salamii TaxID=1612424 RepID=A0A9W4JUE1_9EURO|nr:unnamed protein product [Penicillium salamii]CAG8083199.1 unnamed protein product [Penicillium salamii]CAG8279374.1 unnamed protein product [Penicillium salamii]CAG8281762.1 unnamed protein product [Penicillium salamii]CAG8281787.1 unnamed protein product [Penicillium salamii]